MFAVTTICKMTSWWSHQKMLWSSLANLKTTAEFSQWEDFTSFSQEPRPEPHCRFGGTTDGNGCHGSLSRYNEIGDIKWSLNQKGHFPIMGVIFHHFPHLWNGHYIRRIMGKNSRQCWTMEIGLLFMSVVLSLPDSFDWPVTLPEGVFAQENLSATFSLWRNRL